MRKLGLVLVVGAVAASGCFPHAHGVLHVRASPVAVAAAITAAAIVHAVATAPPVVVNVEYYDYGERPGHVWVNGRHAYVNNAWVWRAGYWQQEQPGHYWVQGYWEPRGNQHVWIEGHWAAPRQGHVYVDGYWDWSDSGYVWRTGTWEVDRPGHVYVGGSWTTYNGRRTWQRGGWQRDDGRADWGRYRARGRVNAGGGVRVRDHRR